MNESCVSASVYVMLSGGHLMQVAAEPIAAKVNIPFSAGFFFDTAQQIMAVAKEQKGYLNAAAEAAFYSALNVHDRGLQSYRYSVGLHKAFGGGGLTLSEGSSSAGLGYALTLALANRQQCQKSGLRAYQAIYATGELGVKRGLVQKIGYLADKIQTAVAHAQSNAIDSFVIFYPADNEADVQSLSAAFLAQLQASGGRLVAVQWVRDALVHLYDEFDGPAVADWTDNPFLGLQSFEISDSWRYFGAKQRLRELYRQYLKAEAQHELLVVTGLSGSGKSSLVKAGLLPNLRGKKGAAIQSISANQFASFEALKQVVVQWAAAIEPADSTRSRVLLIDQFESCVTSLGASTEEWLMWTQQLKAMCQEQPAIRLIVTVRSDFLTLISSAVNRVALVDKRPDELELAEIIEQSAWAAEIELSEALIAQLLADAKTVNYVLPMLNSCFRRLYDHGLKQWGDEAASDPQAWGWRKPTLHVSDYVAIGGLSGVLRQALDEIFTEYGQELTALFFELFVGSRDGLLYARSVPQIELGQHEFLARLVDTLYQQKLLLRAQSDMVSADAESVRLSATASHAYRLGHDCLLSSWPLLQAWVEKQQERVFFEWQNKAAMRYQTWIAEVKINATDRNAEESEAGSTEWLLDGSELSQGVALQGSGNIISPWMRDYLSASQEARATRLSHETRKARRRSLVFAVLAVAALVGGAGAYWQKRVADGERVRAETQQKKAENLLGQTQQSLEFMNWELRPVLEQYVKTEVKEQLISRMEDMLKTLKPYQSAEQSYLNQISLLNSKAKVLLQNKNNKAALQQGEIVNVL